MPREMKSWGGKDIPPAPVAPAHVPLPAPMPPPAPAAPRGPGFPAETPCPRCGHAGLRTLASGALKCAACAAIFSEQHAAPPPAPPREEAEPPVSAALDQIDAINAMLRRNALVLGPGGVPLAEERETAGAGRPGRRNQNRRNSR